jgi:hypothetical protein
MAVKAFYRGCHDPRLYSESNVGLPTRTLMLDRAQVQLASLTESELKATQYSKVSAYVPPYDCIASFGAAAVEASLSTVVDPRECSCQPLGSASAACTAITAARAIEIGIPESIVVSRITP